MNRSDPRHHDLYRQVSKNLIEFARHLVADTDGFFAPTDAARMLMSAGVVTMSNDIGRTACAEYLRALATELERGTPPAELN